MKPAVTPPQSIPSPRSGGLSISEAHQLAATAAALPDTWLVAIQRDNGQLVIEPRSVSQRWRYSYVGLARERVVRAMGYSRYDREH